MTEPIFKNDDFEIWRLIDTETGGCRPADTFPCADRETIAGNRNWLSPYYIDDDDAFRMATQSFVVKLRNELILIDGSVGNGKARYIPWADRLESGFLYHLQAAGHRESDITAVLATHLHIDHVGWFTRWDKSKLVPTFNNARYYFVEEEYTYWKKTFHLNDIDTHISLLDSVEPVVHAGRAEFVLPNFRFNENIYLEPAPGHSPGNVLVHIETGKHHVIFTGDIFHHPIQVNRPAWTADYYDTDIKEALETRIRFLDRYSNSGAVIIGSHFASRPAGVISRKEGERIFQPIEPQRGHYE